MSVLLDASVLVRYFMREPGPLTEESYRIVDGDDQLVLTDIAVLETFFVLRRTYGMPREWVVDGMARLVRKPNVETFPLEKELVIEALLLCRPSGRVAIGDALLWATARMRDEPVHTFDRRFPGDGIEVLTPAQGA